MWQSGGLGSIPAFIQTHSGSWTSHWTAMPQFPHQQNRHSALLCQVHMSEVLCKYKLVGNLLLCHLHTCTCTLDLDRHLQHPHRLHTTVCTDMHRHMSMPCTHSAGVILLPFKCRSRVPLSNYLERQMRSPDHTPCHIFVSLHTPGASLRSFAFSLMHCGVSLKLKLPFSPCARPKVPIPRDQTSAKTCKAFSNSAAHDDSPLHLQGSSSSF